MRGRISLNTGKQTGNTEKNFQIFLNFKNFQNTGNEFNFSLPLISNWKTTNLATLDYMEIDDKPKMKQNYRAVDYYIWNKVYPRFYIEKNVSGDALIDVKLASWMSIR